MANTTGPQANELATLIRHWIHYDTLAGNFSKQSSTSRKIKDEYEKRILHALRNQNMETATIQVAGAKLQVMNEKTYPCLTMGRLEEYLHQYFQKKGQLADETEQIIRFIKQQKMNNFEMNLRLKKIPNAPLVALPLPPGDTQGHLEK